MRCWGLHELANPALLSRFLFSGLLRVAPYCVLSGIRVVSISSSLRHSIEREMKDRKRVFLPFRCLCKWVTNSEKTRVPQNSYSQVQEDERLPRHHQSTT